MADAKNISELFDRNYRLLTQEFPAFEKSKPASVAAAYYTSEGNLIDPDALGNACFLLKDLCDPFPALNGSGLLISATDQYSLFPPNITCMVNREVVGIVTHIDVPGANPERAERWLRLSGCRQIFHVASKSGDGVDDLVNYLSDC